jgi:hypothetical protein
MGKFNGTTKVVEEKVLLTNVQRLMDIINNRRDNKISNPCGMPESQQDAAKWWIKLLEQRFQHEKVDNNIDPYQERLVDCLVEYYKFSHSDQSYILSLFDKGVMWRGDSIKFMKIREKITNDMAIDKVGLMRVMRSMCRTQMSE